jgi:hypothetical protein
MAVRLKPLPHIISKTWRKIFCQVSANDGDALRSREKMKTTKKRKEQSFRSYLRGFGKGRLGRLGHNERKGEVIEAAT